MRVLIIYETQNGSTQYVAEHIQRQLEQAQHQVKLHSVKYDGVSPILDGYEAILFGSPTYDDGKLEKYMLEFTQHFQTGLQGFKVAIFALGNSTYPLFCKSADILEHFVSEHQGKLLVPTLKIDGFPDDTKPISEWAKLLNETLS